LKIVIVGGGISGIVTALSLAETGNEVSILESGSHIGGILRDHEISEQGVWFRNCQYLNTVDKWATDFISESAVAWDVFPHHYGSWSDLFGSVHVDPDFAQISVPACKAGVVSGPVHFTSVEDRLNRYPSELSTPMKAWARRWGDLDLLAPENCEMMQLGRAFFSDDAESTLRQKRESALADELYGVPRSQKIPPSLPEAAALPRAGWNAVFDSISITLRSKGIGVRLKSPATPIWDGKRLSVRCRRELISSDLIIWCANPNPLVYALGLGPLDSPCSKMLNVLFENEGGKSQLPIYWQVFSEHSSLFRIFSYELKERSCLTVEAFDNGMDTSNLSEIVMRVCRACGLNGAAQKVAVVPDRRYVLLTNADKRVFQQLEDQSKSLALITGGWGYYGRDRRVRHVLGSLRDRGVL